MSNSCSCYFLSNIGNTCLANTLFVTSARTPYHAIRAVKIPTYPPIFPILALPAYVAMVSSRNVMNNATNRVFITPFSPNEAIIKIPVNIVQARRNSPVA